MNALQSFMSDSRPSAEAVTLEDPQPDFSTQRIETYAAFEREQQTDSQIAQASPLVRWAAVELSPVRADVPRPLGAKTLA
jgi:hypothetical protein